MKNRIDERRLGDRDADRHREVEPAEVHERDGDGDDRQHHQGAEDRVVGLDRVKCVLTWLRALHANWFARSTRYSSGNRKIQTMSTKCQ